MGKTFGAACCLSLLLAASAANSDGFLKSGFQGSTLTVTVDDLQMLEAKTPELARVRELMVASSYASCQQQVPATVPLPTALGDMRALEELRMGEEGRNGCIGVRVSLPQSMVRLKRLRVLRVDDVFEESYRLPDFLGDLTALEDLALMRSGLRQVPAFVRRLTHLRSLSLSGNPVKTVPGFLAELPVLESIDLSFTDVHQLPPAFARAPALRKIKLGDVGLSDAEKSQLRHDFPKIAFDFDDIYFH
jgi:hypothetical protein